MNLQSFIILYSKVVLYNISCVDCRIWIIFPHITVVSPTLALIMLCFGLYNRKRNLLNVIPSCQQDTHKALTCEAQTLSRDRWYLHVHQDKTKMATLFWVTPVTNVITMLIVLRCFSNNSILFGFA